MAKVLGSLGVLPTLVDGMLIMAGVLAFVLVRIGAVTARGGLIAGFLAWLAFVAGPLAIGFLAGRAVPRHFENPRQVPAFEYPAQYGPRPPSFSRATAVKAGEGRWIFISGTAAVVGPLERMISMSSAS